MNVGLVLLFQEPQTEGKPKPRIYGVVEQNTGKDNQEAKAETIRMTNDRSDLIEGNMGLSCNVFNVVSHGTVYKYCL